MKADPDTLHRSHRNGVRRHDRHKRSGLELIHLTWARLDREAIAPP
jgi:hypothetical protein